MSGIIGGAVAEVTVAKGSDAGHHGDFTEAAEAVVTTRAAAPVLCRAAAIVRPPPKRSSILLTKALPRTSQERGCRA